MAIALLEDLGRWTWNRLMEGKRLGVSQGETTLTDTLLLELSLSGAGRVRVFKVPGSWEPKTGTDYDLFLQLRDGRWARFLVQAKKLGPGGRYASLGHRVGGRAQVDLLLDSAYRTGAFPLYALYNHINLSDFRPYWHCPKPLDHRLLGWTVTPAAVVETALLRRGCRTFEFLHSDVATRPVRCLLDCDRYFQSSSRWPYRSDRWRRRVTFPVPLPHPEERPWVLSRLPGWLESKQEGSDLVDPPAEYLEYGGEGKPRFVVAIEYMER